MNRNEIEEKTWASIDVFMKELCNVALEGVRQGVKAEYIADYIQAETRTIIQNLRAGKPREFDDMLDEFINEVIDNGQYYEWLDYLKFRRGLQDVRLP